MRQLITGEPLASGAPELSENEPCFSTDSLIAAQCQALELVAQGAPLCEVLSFLVQIAEEHTERRAIASILLLDDGGCLRVGAGASLPDYYNNAIDGLKARADLGTCSKAAVTAQIVITPDIEGDPHWADIKHLPLELGLVAAWSRPILSRSGKVLGTFGTYFREKRSPSLHEMRVVEMLARTAGLAVEHQRLDDERARASRELEQMTLTLEEQVAQRTSELLKMNEQLQAFTYSVAHDLRQQIRGISANAGMLLVDAEESLNSESQERLRSLNSAAKQLGRLVDDQLRYAKVGRQALRLEKIDLTALVEASLADAATEHGVADRLVARVEADLTVHADRDLLALAIYNLVDNAVKYSREAAAPQITFGRQADAFFISDNGIGIDMQYSDKLFKPFERLHRGEDYEGTGIGLANVERIIGRHGGRIWAESKPGEGAKMYFSLGSAMLA